MLRQVNVTTGQESVGTYTQSEIDARVVTVLTRDDLRRKAYNAQGSTIDEMIVALWERVVEGRNATSDALEVTRQQVKIDIP